MTMGPIRTSQRFLGTHFCAIRKGAQFATKMYLQTGLPITPVPDKSYFIEFEIILALPSPITVIAVLWYYHERNMITVI